MLLCQTKYSLCSSSLCDRRSRYVPHCCALQHAPAFLRVKPALQRPAICWMWPCHGDCVARQHLQCRLQELPRHCDAECKASMACMSNCSCACAHQCWSRVHCFSLSNNKRALSNIISGQRYCLPSQHSYAHLPSAFQ